ncbi:hypothetical protein Tco_0955597 [Tanacetum coccineum]|uniref:Uncharacterized protein n=1 Tax=Tanacetum coccineum TaxID=301880 RepID=A0ABQ5E7N0_9ASTR
MGVLNLAKKAFKDEFNGRAFTQEGSCEVLRNYPKWDAPEAVPSAPVEGGHTELFGEDSRPRPSGAHSMTTEFRLKRKLAQEKDRAVIKFEELRFLATKTDGLSEKDAENKSGQNIDVRSRRRSFYYRIVVLIIVL